MPLIETHCYYWTINISPCDGRFITWKNFYCDVRVLSESQRQLRRQQTKHQSACYYWNIRTAYGTVRAHSHSLQWLLAIVFSESVVTRAINVTMRGAKFITIGWLPKSRLNVRDQTRVYFCFGTRSLRSGFTFGTTASRVVWRLCELSNGKWRAVKRWCDRRQWFKFCLLRNVFSLSYCKSKRPMIFSLQKISSCAQSRYSNNYSATVEMLYTHEFVFSSSAVGLKRTLCFIGWLKTA